MFVFTLRTNTSLKSIIEATTSINSANRIMSNRYLLFNISLPCSGQMFATSQLAMTSEQSQLVFTCLKSRCMKSVQS